MWKGQKTRERHGTGLGTAEAWTQGWGGTGGRGATEAWMQGWGGRHRRRGNRDLNTGMGRVTKHM